jgi:hypothetical protein
MSYPALIQSLPSPMRSALKDPFSVAAIASIGLHGLLWVLLPILPNSLAAPREPEIQREVGVIQLTPEELKRIPASELPRQPSVSLPQSAIPLTLPPRSLNQLPNQYSFSPLPTQPAIPYLPPLPPSFYIPSYTPPTFSLPPLPPLRSTTPPVRSGRSTPSPSPSTQATPTPQPRIEYPNLTGRASTTQLDLQVSPRPSVSASPTAPPQTLAEANRQLQERYRQLLTYNAQGTRQEDGNTAFGAWFYQELGRRSLSDLVSETINAIYPREACVLQRSAQVVYGVVVNSDDKISGDPRKLLSSGFPIFDQRALEVLQAHTFNNSTDADQVYQVNIRFEYSGQVCPATTAPAPTPSPASSPAG